jgi:hypothetical protein
MMDAITASVIMLNVIILSAIMLSMVLLVLFHNTDSPHPECFTLYSSNPLIKFYWYYISYLLNYIIIILMTVAPTKGDKGSPPPSIDCSFKTIDI